MQQMLIGTEISSHQEKTILPLNNAYQPGSSLSKRELKELQLARTTFGLVLFLLPILNSIPICP